MIEFLTLFLGLTSGTHSVALNVTGPVAAIEIQLDGKQLATLEQPPWVFECDLGTRPLPHDLVAIARDASGQELDRIEQWINMDSKQSRAVLAVRTDDQGQPKALKLEWESIGEVEPEQIEVVFDGEVLDVSNPDNIPLPSHDRDEFHFLSADLEFANAGSSRRESDYGGGRGAEISTELTAIVVETEKRHLPAPSKMAGWFSSQGKTAAIHGVEKGPIELFVVRGPGAQEALDSVAIHIVKSGYQVNHGTLGEWSDWRPAEFFVGSPEEVAQRLLEGADNLLPLRRFGGLDSDVRLNFTSPIPGALVPRGVSSEMFLKSPTYSSHQGGLNWLFQRQRQPMTRSAKVSAAVGLAGMIAHGTNKRRAVLLMTAETTDDSSTYSPQMIRSYLAALEVPLHVWSFGQAVEAHDWQQVVDLGDPAKDPADSARRLARATIHLRRSLRQQRVIWLEGRYLPHQVTLSPAARNLTLAGSAQ